MPAYALIGAQWGDEGKGKVIDYLAADAHWVVRYAGGNNAGHTVINANGTFSLHLVPSGVFHPNVSCVIGNGVVVDPQMLLREIEDLQKQGIDTGNIFLSDRAHLIMPYHIQFDALEESARGSSSLGTTGRGVGPAYVDKVARMGIRAGDLINRTNSLKPLLSQVIKEKNKVLTMIYKEPPISVTKIYDQCISWSKRLKSMIVPTDLLLQEALYKGEIVLLEGAQGTLLDIDHGTYPYVTSSSASVGGVSAGLGIRPQAISGVIGVFKAYSTRVGSGPMPTEMDKDTASQVRELASEYGATTGRARRIGWFDAMAGRYSRNINGFTSIVLTRLDVLDGFQTVNICVGYKVNGQTLDHFPSDTTLLDTCEPIYEEMHGWHKPTAGTTKLEDLPQEAIKYIKRIEELIGCEFHLISTGPHRDETIVVKRII